MTTNSDDPQRICIILNPGARQGNMLEELERRLSERSDVEIRVTEREQHAQELAANAVEEGFDVVVAAGGDGTLNEVVNGLCAGNEACAGGRRSRLGLLPLGTGNDFARSIHLPNLDTALTALEQGRSQRCDVVRFTGSQASRYFINLSAAGFSGEVDDRLTPEIKQTWGPLAYLRAAIESLPELCPYTIRLTFDEEEEVEISGLNLIVANAGYVAAGIPIAPTAEISDGLFDVIVLKACEIPSLALLATKVLIGQHLASEAGDVFYRRARILDVSADPDLPVNVDGELVGRQSGRFEIFPGALEIIVGEPKPSLFRREPTV